MGSRARRLPCVNRESREWVHSFLVFTIVDMALHTAGALTQVPAQARFLQSVEAVSLREPAERPRRDSWHSAIMGFPEHCLNTVLTLRLWRVRSVRLHAHAHARFRGSRLG